MRTPLLAGCLGLLLCSAPGTAEDKPKTDQDALQGSWELDSQWPIAKPVVLCEKVVFKGDKLTFHYKLDDQREALECTFKLDSKANPPTIDFTPTAGSNKGKTYLGLYELNKGNLWLCYRGPDSTRPKDFDDEKAGNDGTMFYVFKSPGK